MHQRVLPADLRVTGACMSRGQARTCVLVLGRRSSYMPFIMMVRHVAGVKSIGVQLEGDESDEDLAAALSLSVAAASERQGHGPAEAASSPAPGLDPGAPVLPERP